MWAEWGSYISEHRHTWADQGGGWKRVTTVAGHLCWLRGIDVYFCGHNEWFVLMERIKRILGGLVYFGCQFERILICVCWMWLNGTHRKYGHEELLIEIGYGGWWCVVGGLKVVPFMMAAAALDFRAVCLWYCYYTSILCLLINNSPVTIYVIFICNHIHIWATNHAHSPCTHQTEYICSFIQSSTHIPITPPAFAAWGWQ